MIKRSLDADDRGVLWCIDHNLPVVRLTQKYPEYLYHVEPHKYLDEFSFCGCGEAVEEQPLTDEKDI